MTVDLRQTIRAESYPPDEPCVVYYLGTSAGGAVKIGITVDLPRRLRTLRRRMIGVGLHVLAVEEVADRFLESRRHLQFRASRLAGEWFALTPDLAEHIAALQDVARDLAEFDAFAR